MCEKRWPMTATTPFIAVVTAGRTTPGKGRSTVISMEVSRCVPCSRGLRAYHPTTPAGSSAPGAGSWMKSMRCGSSKSIRSRKVNEKCAPSTGILVSCHTQCSPSSCTECRNGVSRAMRAGSVSTSQTASTSAVTVAADRFDVENVATPAP